MEISTKQLRTEPGRIVTQAARGEEITITYRGKPRAKIVPITSEKKNVSLTSENELFGIWKERKDMENVEQFVRNTRKGRKLC